MDSITSIFEMVVGAQLCNTSIQEVGDKGSEVQFCSLLYLEFEGSLGFVRTFLKKKKRLRFAYKAEGFPHSINLNASHQWNKLYPESEY